MIRAARAAARLVLAAALGAGGAACRQDMYDQPRQEPFEASPFFADGASARPLVDGAVARSRDDLDGGDSSGGQDDGGRPDAAEVAARTAAASGAASSPRPGAGASFWAGFPVPVDRALVLRGRERYDIYCSPCHDRAGDGRGMIVRRGFRPPPSFHIERLRQAPAEHFIDVMTNGFGSMPEYSVPVPPRDRWAIAAYIRALQSSRAAALAEIPAPARQALLKEAR